MEIIKRMIIKGAIFSVIPMLFVCVTVLVARMDFFRIMFIMQFGLISLLLEGYLIERYI